MLRKVAFLLPALALFAAAPAHAQDDDPYATCAGTQDDAERLACFDATYTRQQVVTAEREERQEEQRERAFGFREEEAAIDGSAEDERVITATVTEVLRGAGRSQVLLLDNGQLWREITGSTMRNRVRDGRVATISRHWSGAYEMRVEGSSGYLRVARLR